MIFALVITLGAYAMVDLNVTGELSPTFPYLAGGCVVLALARPPGGPLAAAVRRPGDPALRGAAQRSGAGDDPPDRPDQHPAGQRRPAAADLDHARGDHVHPGRRRCCAITARCSGYTYTLGLAGIVLLLLPLVPGHRHREVRRADLDPRRAVQLPAGRGRQDLLAIAFASYLVEKRDVLALAGYRVLGIDLPRARDLGPILVMWLISLAHPGLPARPRHLAAVLRAVRDDAVRLHRTGRLGGARHAAVRRRAPSSAYPDLRPRPGPGRAPGWTRSRTTTPTTR